MQQVHPLTKYLLREAKTITWLAKRARCSRSGLSRVIAGKKRCGADLAHRLEPATDYTVSVQELTGWGRVA